MKSVLIVLLLALTLSGCQTTKASKSIKLAVVGHEVVYDYDKSFLNGVEMAVEDCLAEYDFDITWEYYNDDYEYEKGMLIIDRLVSDPLVTAVFGSHNFSVLEASAGKFEEADKIMLAVNGMIDETILDKGYDLVFRNTLGEKEMGYSLAKYAFDQGHDRIAVVHSNSRYERSLTNSFALEAKKLGLKVVDFVPYLGIEDEFTTLLERWEAIGVNAVLITCEILEDSFTVAKQIKQRNKNISLYGDFSFDAEELLLANKEYVEGLVFPSVLSIASSSELDELMKRYEDRYHETPSFWAAHAYNSVRMIVDSAAEIKSTKPADIAEKLHSDGYDGICGTYEFDANGVLKTGEPIYMIVKDSKPTLR